MELCSNRVILHPITEAHTSLILKWRNSPHIKSCFIHRQDITEEEHYNWLMNEIGSGRVCQFVIYLRENAQPIGSIYIQRIDPVLKSGEYGIFIGEKDEQGKGYGTEASHLIIQYAFDVLKLNKIYLRVLTNNIKAINCYTKLGFVQEEVKRNLTLKCDSDVMYMSISSTEYKKV